MCSASFFRAFLAVAQAPLCRALSLGHARRILAFASGLWFFALLRRCKTARGWALDTVGATCATAASLAADLAVGAGLRFLRCNAAALHIQSGAWLLDRHRLRAGADGGLYILRA